MKLIAHVILDEKFIDNAITVFSAIPDTVNQFLLVSKTGNCEYIKQVASITVFTSQQDRLSYIKKQKPDIVILHSLFMGAMLVPFVTGKIPVVWISWGHDLYKDKDQPCTSSYPFRHALFMPETREWIKRHRSMKKAAQDTIKLFIKNIFRSMAIRRISYVSTCLPYEFSFIVQRYPHLKRFSFDYIDDTAISLGQCMGKNIIIGNSASVNCNHLDVLSLLRVREIHADKIVVPLSYAGSAVYRNAVSARGKELFGSSFMPLSSFMPIDEYAALIQSCGFAVMGFLRQQATKNIQLLLYQGTKVFFYRETEIFRYFSASGYRVFSIEDDLTTENLHTLLSKEDAEINRSMIARDFSYDTNIENLKKSLEGIFSNGEKS